MTIESCNFAGKKAIVRVDFNVPLNENGQITDDTRIRGALPTLKKVLADGGALIIMSHMGKPKGKVNPKFSLGQIKDAVAAALDAPVSFAPDCAKAQEAAAALKPAGVDAGFLQLQRHGDACSAAADDTDLGLNDGARGQFVGVDQHGWFLLGTQCCEGKHLTLKGKCLSSSG